MNFAQKCHFGNRKRKTKILRSSFPFSHKCQGNVSAASLCKIMQTHFTTLEGKLTFSFPSIAINCYDWVRNPYSSEVEFYDTMTLQEQEELIQLRQNHGLRLRLFGLPLHSFWVIFFNEFTKLEIRAVFTLLPFSTTYLCETTFSAMTAIKVKKTRKVEGC